MINSMSNKRVYFNTIYSHVKKTKKQLDEVVKVSKRRHPHEEWYERYVEIDGRVNTLYSVEFLLWLKEVYYNREGYYLDREIKFYETRVKEIEKELNLETTRLSFDFCLLKDLPIFFNKSKRGVVYATKKMREENDCIFEYKNDDGLIVITAEGVKWLAKNYFKKYYLEKLEKYKRDLQEGNVVKEEI